MVTWQSANQLKTPVKISWVFKIVSQFGSLGYTIMGKTIIDTLHKEGKTQTFTAKEAVCSQSAVSKHVNRKFSGRKKCGRKRCTTNRENRSIMRIVKKKLIQEFGWTSQGMDWGWGQGIKSTTHRRVEEFGYSCRQRRLNWTKKKKNWTVAQWSKVLFSEESKFCISFGNQVPRVWRKGGEAHSTSWSPVLNFRNLGWFGCNVIYWCWSTVFFVSTKLCHCVNVTAPVYQDILEHFMLPSADQLFKDADFIFQQDLAPAHTARITKSWLNDHGVGVLDWPANSPDLSSVENLWSTVKRKMRNKRPKKCRWAEGHCQRNLGFHTTSAVPQTDHLHVTPNWDSN